MTREEWQDKLEDTLMEADEGYGRVIDYDIIKESRRVIGYLLDDIESRICENCTFYKIEQDDDEGYCSQLDNWYIPTFGCNIFEVESK